MAFLPEGSVVFQQYISSEIPTFATYLKGLGYETIGMHPYQGSGWERDRVYPLMGFDRFLDQGSFAGADKLRNYVSDKGAFDKVIELFENKEEGTSQFQFLVTMQNHSGYSPKDTDNGFSEEVMLTDAPVQSPSVVAAERYLTLIKYSDQAFGELIDYFEENVTEPTLIVMFGDHEPNDYVTNVIDDLVGNASFVTASDNSGAADATEESLEDVQKHYQVPFVIWNNFGLKKDESIDLTSVNYLGAILAQQAGLPMSAQQKFLRLMQKQIPALAAGAYVGEDGAFHSWSQRGQDEKNKGLINDYQMLEYNHLMDVKNRLTWVYLAPGTEQGTGSS
jgi:arylsulfatase A-like enzyme